MLFRPRTPMLLLILGHLGTSEELGLIALALALPMALYLLVKWMLALATMPFIALFELLGLRRRRVVVYPLKTGNPHVRETVWTYRVGSAAQARQVCAILRGHLEAGADWFDDERPEPRHRPLPQPRR
ncbi:hypothetical protein [Stackebrandtia soli]|uniref:hypothetical protein n=1 Tax=Stackebrandtia soli TaxID=1892856 RepID=UPI0039E982D5